MSLIKGYERRSSRVPKGIRLFFRLSFSDCFCLRFYRTFIYFCNVFLLLIAVCSLSIVINVAFFHRSVRKASAFSKAMGNPLCPYFLDEGVKVDVATCLSVPRSSLVSYPNLPGRGFSASVGAIGSCNAVPASLSVAHRQSLLHGLSRQHTATGQTSSSFILIVLGFPCLLFGFHLFVFSLTAQSRGMPLRYWHCHLHRSPCSCSAQCTLPILDFHCHLCDEGKDLLLLPCLFKSLYAFHCNRTSPRAV